MQIDWLTVIAQIINFLILVWLLKRFLYKPVIDAMEKREALIASRLSEAGQREQSADTSRQHYEQLEAALTRDRDDILQQTRQKADADYHQWLEQARQEIEQQKAGWLRELRKEQAAYLQALREEGGKAVLRTTAQVLRDMAAGSLEQRVVEVFIDKLNELPEPDRQHLAHGSGPLIVSTANALDDDLRGRLQRAFQALAPDRTVEYRRLPALLCGIELKADERKISWHMAGYLDGLEQQMLAVLKAQDAGASAEGGP